MIQFKDYFEGMSRAQDVILIQASINLKVEEKTYEHLEIGLHRTAKAGHVYVDQQYFMFLPYTRNDGSRILQKMTLGSMDIFPNASSLIQYINTKYGENNLQDFSQMIDIAIHLMLQNKYVREWKGLNK